MEIFAVGLARKRTCTGFADKHCKPTREGSAVHSYATKFPLSGKHNFPCTEISRRRCRVYQTRLSLPFGVDDSVAADYLCQQKKAMKNGKHKTNSFNSSNSWSKKQSSLPSLQGGAGGRLFPSRSTVNPQDWCFGCFKCFRCFRCFKCFISLLDQKIARFWSKSEQNRCFVTIQLCNNIIKI